MLEIRKTGMPPSMVSQFEVHASQASVHRKWSEGSKHKRFDLNLTKLELNGIVFHYFNEVDTFKNCPRSSLFHCFRSLTQEEELYSNELKGGGLLRLQQDDELSGKESPSLSGPAGYFWRKVYF